MDKVRRIANRLSETAQSVLTRLPVDNNASIEFWNKASSREAQAGRTLCRRGLTDCFGIPTTLGLKVRAELVKEKL